MSNSVKLQVNVNNGEYSIEAPSEVLESAIEQLANMISRLPAQAEPVRNTTEIFERASLEDETGQTALMRPLRKQRRSNVETVNVRLNPKQSEKITEYFTHVNPATQSDTLLVLMRWLKENVSRGSNVTRADLLNAAEIAGVNNVPKAFFNIINMLRKDGYVGGTRGNYQITKKGIQYVDDLISQTGNPTLDTAVAEA